MGPGVALRGREGPIQAHHLVDLRAFGLGERALVFAAADIGAKVDSREGQTPGAKFYHWERRGVPLVLELGPRDLASGNREKTSPAWAG